MANEIEYILETKPDKDWQKQLNQWKHIYDINIISMNNTEFGGVTILLIRTKKPTVPFDHTTTNMSA